MWLLFSPLRLSTLPLKMWSAATLQITVSDRWSPSSQSLIWGEGWGGGNRTKELGDTETQQVGWRQWGKRMGADVWVCLLGFFEECFQRTGLCLIRHTRTNKQRSFSEDVEVGADKCVHLNAPVDHLKSGEPLPLSPSCVLFFGTKTIQRVTKYTRIH